MSYIISKLGLEHPPFTIERLGNKNVAVWRAVCECGDRSKAYPRIGTALEEMSTHGDVHSRRQDEMVA